MRIGEGRGVGVQFGDHLPRDRTHRFDVGLDPAAPVALFS
jgi:hypothetical protein